MRIAFHTPLNATHDGRISGDRRIAGQIEAAFRRLGQEVMPIEAARSYLRSADPADLAAIEARDAARADALVEDWRRSARGPDLWFTYHSYFKAPDLLGPAITQRLAVPYVLAEASHAARRLDGVWARPALLAKRSIKAADLHLCFTPRDRRGIAPLCRPETPILDLPPFITSAGPVRTQAPDDEPVRLLVIAIMREGKYPSYLALARMLARIADRRWSLTIIGDGPRRPDIEAAFAVLPEGRVTWRGLIPHEETLDALARHDIFVWPGVREAYGLVYLEAQAAGLPVVAFDSGGVPAMVKPHETALLASENDEAALADALTHLLDDAALRHRMGEAASRFVRTERTAEAADAILERALAEAVRVHAEAAR